MRSSNTWFFAAFIRAAFVLAMTTGGSAIAVAQKSGEKSGEKSGGTLRIYHRDTTPSASTFEVKLGAGVSPGVTTGHIARYRAKGTGSLTVRLIQGTTVIATNTPSITGAYQTFSFTLSGAEAATITDYTDLRLRFTSS